jgi:hypothetical protein
VSKKYVFELTIHEGSDEFWDSIKGKTGCDEVTYELKKLIEAEGYYFCDGEYKNCDLLLKSYSNE